MTASEKITDHTGIEPGTFESLDRTEEGFSKPLLAKCTSTYNDKNTEIQKAIAIF